MLKNYINTKTTKAAQGLAILVFGAVLALSPLLSSVVTAAGSIAPAGGGNFVVGQSFSVRVVASGAEFDALQGIISVSGPATVSVVPGGATWLPNRAPSNGGQFVGIAAPTRSLVVATVNLTATGIGRGAVTVSGVRLARNGVYVGDRGGSIAFSVGRAPTPPGAVELSSPTHPDQSQAYEETTVTINWQPPANGATGYSHVFDQSAETVPPTTVTTTETTFTQAALAIGTYFFHIRAQNADGWGPTSRFKVTIREPDPKIDETLVAPSIVSVEKAEGFTTDTTLGTVSNIRLRGTVPVGFVGILDISPRDRLPQTLFQAITEAPVAEMPVEGQTEVAPAPAPIEKEIKGVTITPLMSEPDAAGNWKLLITAPIPVGFYTLTLQGQAEKVLTPLSQPVSLELSVADGGQVKFITDADKIENQPVDRSVQVLGARFTTPLTLVSWLTGILVALISLFLIIFFGYKRIQQARRRRSEEIIS